MENERKEELLGADAKNKGRSGGGKASKPASPRERSPSEKKS